MLTNPDVAYKYKVDWTIQQKHIGWLVPGAVFVIYVLSLAPGLTWSHFGADGGDLLSSVASRQVPHPPGFPVYILFGKLVSLIPFRTLAWRLNALSAIMAAGTVWMVLLTLQRMDVQFLSAVAASLTLGFAPLFWSQAIITEVYTTAAFFTSLTHYLMIRSQASGKGFWLPGITWGMAVAVHPTTLFFVFGLWARQKKAWYGIFAAIPVIFLFYISLLLWAHPVQKWADFTSIQGWLSYVTGQLYWDYSLTMTVPQVMRRILSWLTLFSQQFTPAGAVLVLAGLRYLWHHYQRRFFSWLVSLCFLSFYAIAYNTVDSFVYMVLFLPLCIPALGKGMDWIVKKGLPSLGVLAIPLLLILLNWQSISLKHDYEAEIWLQSILRQAPEDAILLSNKDEHTFTLWSEMETSGMHGDIMVIDTRLWNYLPYKNYISEKYHITPNSLDRLGTFGTLCTVFEKGITCQ